MNNCLHRPLSAALVAALLLASCAIAPPAARPSPTVEQAVQPAPAVPDAPGAQPQAQEKGPQTAQPQPLLPAPAPTSQAPAAPPPAAAAATAGQPSSGAGPAEPALTEAAGAGAQRRIDPSHSLAQLPTREPALAQPPVAPTPQPPAPVPPPSALAPPSAPRPSAYLVSALASFSNVALPSGGRLALRSLPGRALAAAEIALPTASIPAPAGSEGAMALGLALAARGKRGDAPGSLSRRIDAAGGRLELKLLSYDAIALELVSPPAALADLVAALLDAMADPAFAADDFPSDQFDSVMRDFRLRKLRENGDPLLVAAEAQRYAIYRGHPYSNPPFGTETSLLGLGRKEVAARWKATLASSGIMISAAGDLDPAVFARIITPSLLAFGPLGGASPAPARSPAPLAPPPPIRKNLIVQLLPGATSAYLRADFAVPPIESPDYAALSLALTMLDDIMLEELRGIQPSAYDAYSRLSPAASPSGTLFVTRAASAAGAKAGVERAISILAGGKCFSPLGSGYEATADGIDAYKSRAIARVYGRGASAAGIAERMARDLAAGGDGSSYFRMADRIAAVKAEDLTRVARERLKDAPLAWAIAGNAESIGNLAGVP